jgi:hypothetical protein
MDDKVKLHKMCLRFSQICEQPAKVPKSPYRRPSKCPDLLVSAPVFRLPENRWLWANRGKQYREVRT